MKDAIISGRALLVLSLLLLSQRARADALTPQQSLAHEIHAELVGIDTTETRGGSTEAATRMAHRLRDAGFSEQEIFLDGPSPRKLNLVARLRGAGSEKPLLLLAHLDVVEARREDWSVEPFELLERDGFYYGRGSLDDKAMAAIFTAKLIELKRSGAPLDRDVILALTADEEGGPENGVDWLLQTHRPLVEAGLVLNEGGGGRMRKGRYLANTLQASEKTYMSFALEVRDPGGHSSLPRRDNPIYRLAAGLTRLAAYEFPVELSAITQAYLERSAATETGETASAMAALARDPKDSAAAAKLSETPSYNAVLRTTCVATRLDAGHANNALPQLARAVVNCRILPGHAAGEVQQELARVLADDRIVISPLDPEVASPLLPIDPVLLTEVEKITAELYPGVPVVPSMSSGASDSKYFRRAGIPAYGVSGIFSDIDDVRVHGRDERVGVKQFQEGQAFLDRLVDALARPAK